MNVIKKINVYYHESKMSGHWVLGRNPEHALFIAKTHRIGYPMGRQSKRMLITDQTFDPEKKYGGSVWAEKRGELISYPTPLGEALYRKLINEGT